MPSSDIRNLSSEAVGSLPDMKLASLPSSTPDGAFHSELQAPSLQLNAGQSLRHFLTSTEPMRLLWKSEAERAEALIFEFAQRGVPQQIIRWTGWSGNIGEYGPKLESVVKGFEGVKGFHMFGGTQIRDLDSGVVIPTVCDIPVALKKQDRDLILIGVIPKVSEEPIYKEGLGLVLRVNEKENRFTTVNDDQNIGIVLQPDVNGKYEWIDEIKESRRQCSRLMEKKWKGTLVVFGGTVTPDEDLKLRNVEQELVWWAQDAKAHPDWDLNIVLIRGSGGVADKYANNPDWLRENPSVKVFDADASAIADGLSKLGGMEIKS
jgi:hypothetical protein